MEMTDKLIAGSRGSKLALWQTNYIADALECEVEVQRITTRGDKIQDVALAKIEGKGFFTKEIDDALVRGDIDFAVHSFKDVPTDLPDGVIIASLPKRESPRDALVSGYGSLDELPGGAKVGTASLRRKALALSIRNDLVLEDLRGNLDTRVRKQKEGQYDAVIVAEAGLKRMGYTDYHPLDPDEFIPAVGQGAIAITARGDDERTLSYLRKLEDSPTRIACEAEREFLQTLEGGCQVPAGIYSKLDGERLELTGFVSSVDGKRLIRETLEEDAANAKETARTLARNLLDAGGSVILEEIRKEEG
jgi:hydroxymethylbilane synthase